jgi:hypothetical protein
MDVLVLPMRKWVVADVSGHVAPIFKAQISRTADRFYQHVPAVPRRSVCYVSLFTVPIGTNCPNSALPAVGLRGSMATLPAELTTHSDFYPAMPATGSFETATQPTSLKLTAGVASNCTHRTDGRNLN